MRNTVDEGMTERKEEGRKEEEEEEVSSEL